MKHGQLKVWWIPQVPMKRFEVDVDTLAEGKLLLETLAKYDRFQFENNIKPDYANVGGLMAFSATEKDWVDWHSEDGEDIDEYFLETIRTNPPKWGEAE